MGLAMSWRSDSFQLKTKTYLESRNQRDTIITSYTIEKIWGLISRDIVIWNNFLEYRTNQATLFARQNDVLYIIRYK